MSDNTMNIAGEMSAIAANNGIYTLVDNALRLSTESLSSAIDNKVTIDNRLCNVVEQTDLSIVKLSASEYYDLVNSDTVISNVIYVVENQFKNAYGQQIKNLAQGTDLSDAVNLEQLNAVSANAGTITGITMNGASKGTSGNVDLGTVLTAHQSLANYYTKSETSSANEISTALENAGSGSSRYALVMAQLVADNGSLTCAVDDQTITTIQVSSSATPVVIQLPAQPEDGARDFILRIEISSSTAPTFTFSGVNETIDFDSEDDDWAVMEPGLNLVSFTETKRGN